MLDIFIRFIASENSTVDDAFFAALAADEDLGRTRGIDGTLKQFNLDAILLPTNGFTAGPAAIAGYPVVTGQHDRCTFIIDHSLSRTETSMH